MLSPRTTPDLSQQLQRLITVAPAAVKELMAEFGCTVPPSVEALALLKQVHGEAFADELFILLRAAEQVGRPQVANFTGPQIEPAGTPAKRGKLSQVLDKIAETVMAVESVANGGSTIKMPPTPPSDGSGDGSEGENADDKPSKRIFGLSAPIFYLACAVLLLLAVVLLVRKSK